VNLDSWGTAFPPIFLSISPVKLASILVTIVSVSDIVMDLGRHIVEELGKSCFAGCPSLSSVTFESHSRLSLIERGAFSPCRSLSSFCIPLRVEMVSEECFSGSKSLSKVTIESGSGVFCLETSVFSECARLASACIPSSVQQVCQYCFCRYQSLSTIIFEPGSRVLCISVHAFYGCASVQSIWLPSSVEQLGSFALPGENLPDICVDDGLSVFKIDGNFVIDIRCMSIARFRGNVKEVTNPGYVTRLDHGCFAHSPCVSVVGFEPRSKVSCMKESAFFRLFISFISLHSRLC
jgi:hypothetical protein